MPSFSIEEGMVANVTVVLSTEADRTISVDFNTLDIDAIGNLQVGRGGCG